MVKYQGPFKSDKKNKKFYILLYNPKTKKYDSKIHFGDKRYEDFTQHKDLERRRLYLARATKIKDSKGKLTYLNPNSPNYWSVKLLWSG
jgi:hypothetical protein